MGFACSITRATDTNSEYVVLIGSNGYANAPQCYIIVHCFFCLLLWLS